MNKKGNTYPKILLKLLTIIIGCYYRHADDIMSLVFCRENNLIYTGGHDGSLIAWNFETGYVKCNLHDYDKSCMSKEYIKDSKSVDCVSDINPVVVFILLTL